MMMREYKRRPTNASEMTRNIAKMAIMFAVLLSAALAGSIDPEECSVEAMMVNTTC